MTFTREGKFTSSHFFASKDVMGCEIADVLKPERSKKIKNSQK